MAFGDISVMIVIGHVNKEVFSVSNLDSLQKVNGICRVKFNKK